MTASSTHARRDRARCRGRARATGSPLVMVTAYDAPSARTVDAAGVDMILVGDSLAMVVLGYDDTLQVTTDDMAHHVGAVARTRPHALVVADLPWLSYHVSREETVHNAAALIRAGAGAVKLEGGRKRHRRGAGDPRRRDPGDGSHRPHAAVDPRARRVQGAGQGARRGAGARRRRGRARRGRLLRDRARVRARRRGAHDHRVGRRPDDRHRRRPALRRPGARVARPARLRGPEHRRAEVRARVRGARARRDRGDRAVLRRRARGHVPVERGDVPHDRSHGRRARPVRRHDAPSPSSRSSACVSPARVRDRRRPWSRWSRSAGSCSLVVRSASDDDATRPSAFALRRSARAGAVRASSTRRASRSVDDACACWSRRRTRSASQGLRERARSLGPYDGMLFVFPRDTDARFTMADTPMPLDITFFAADGAPVDAHAHDAVPDRHRRDVPGVREQGAATATRSRRPRVARRRPARSARAA